MPTVTMHRHVMVRKPAPPDGAPLARQWIAVVPSPNVESRRFVANPLALARTTVMEPTAFAISWQARRVKPAGAIVWHHLQALSAATAFAGPKRIAIPVHKIAPDELGGSPRTAFVVREALAAFVPTRNVETVPMPP